MSQSIEVEEEEVEGKNVEGEEFEGEKVEGEEVEVEKVEGEEVLRSCGGCERQECDSERGGPATGSPTLA